MMKSGMRIVTIGAALAIALASAGGWGMGRAQAAGPAQCVMTHDSMGAATFHPPTLPAKIVRAGGTSCKTFSYVLTNGSYQRVQHACRFGNQTVDYGRNYRTTLRYDTTQIGQAVPAEAPVAAAQPAMTGTLSMPGIPAITETAPMTETPPITETADMTQAAPMAESPAMTETASITTTLSITSAQSMTETPAMTETASTATADIVDSLSAAGDFTVLINALQAAGLSDVLKSEGPFTIFAPTDAAFAALPEGTLHALLADPTGALQQILLYHVVPRRLSLAHMLNGMDEATAEGDLIKFIQDGAVTRIDGASIVAGDIEATNGLIHVIDAVLAPPAQ